jgi:hypothetical protein
LGGRRLGILLLVGISVGVMTVLLSIGGHGISRSCGGC